jgi:signal recognition particle subunit SRP68
MMASCMSALVTVCNPKLVNVLIKVQEGEVKLSEESTEISRSTMKGQEKNKQEPGRGGISKCSVVAYDNILLASSNVEDIMCKLFEAQNISKNDLLLIS